MIMNYIWLGVVAFALIAEALTVQMVAIWFAPAALVAFVLNLLKAPVPLQITVFVWVAAVCVAIFYRKLRNNIKDSCEKTNLDAVIGSIATVEEDITDEGGRVKIKGISWKAECNIPVKAGEKVKVISIDGVTVKCEKIKTVITE